MYLKKIFLVLALLIPGLAWAQFQGTERPAGDSTLVLSLEDAIRIALSENTSVKVADMEIRRQKYAHKGTYAALFLDKYYDTNGQKGILTIDVKYPF